jgi:PIN domain nuclease of toxin-antitoxin system
VSLLLDTHVVLWWLSGDPALPATVKGRIDDERDIFVSAATSWEIAIKQAAGKLHAPVHLADAIADHGFRLLPVMFEHASAAGRLPLIHRDPFDRMLVAQARCEGLTLVTPDPVLQQYDVELLVVRGSVGGAS